MNKIYRLRWSKRLGCLVVTSERTKGAQGKKSRSRLLLATVSTLALMLSAGPVQGDEVIDDGDSITVPVDRPNEWDIDGDLTVGEVGAGELTIEDGGTVRNDFGYIGREADGDGTVTVTGAGSTWANSRDLHVGEFGAGELTIEDGGTVRNDFAYVGYFAASKGSAVTVTGADSTWEIGRDLYVGRAGTGELRIEDGGTVSAKVDSFIGGDSGSEGMVIVTGKGSTWENDWYLYVGRAGTGELRIEDGGTISSHRGFIGNDSGSEGTVIVTGEGSTWENDTTLYVGHSGTGTLTIADGGTVRTVIGMIGLYPDSEGSAVTVTGDGSTLENSEGFSVGRAGTGELRIEDGGTVRNHTGSVGFALDSEGAAIVTGAGSTWENDGDLRVGHSGTGKLTIEDEGGVRAANVVVASNADGQGHLMLAGAADARGTLSAGQLAEGDGDGTVTFDGGILQATRDETAFLSGFDVGDVTIDAGGAFIDSNGHDIGISSALDGIGSLTKMGAGTLTLSGANTYTGGTTISEGTLQIGDGGTSGSIVGDVVNNAALVFNRSDDLSYGGVISGTGTLTKRGSGALTLTGTHTYTGVTEIDDGTLIVNGSVGEVSVNSGGTLGGSGAVGTTTVASGGTLAPGNSIGTLTVDGDLTFDPGSVYEVEVDPSGTTSDHVHVTGDAHLAGGVLHIGENGTYKPFSTYTILTADGDLHDTFDAVSSGYAFLDPTLDYDYVAKRVELSLMRNDVSFGSVGRTRNQRAVAGGMESLGAGNGLHDTVVAMSADDARSAFDSLSGEVHASTHSALHGATGFASNVPLNHLRTNLNGPLQPGAPLAQAGDAPIPASALPHPHTLPLWVEAVGNWQRLDDDGNAASVDHDTGGIFVGGDHSLANGWHLGGAFGYTDSRIRVSDRRSKADADSYSLALYGGKAFQQQNGTLNVMLGGAYTWHNVDAKRDVTIGGATQHLTADYDAKTTQFFGEVGYAFPVTRNTRLEPFAGLAWRELRSESFREKGGSAALNASSNSNDVTTTTLGLRALHDLKLGGRDASLNATLGWRHAEGDVTPSSRFAFQGGEAFTVAGAPIARDATLIEVGASMMLSHNASLGISYAGQYGDGNRDQTGRVSLRWRF